jgi:hypothetical protein
MLWLAIALPFLLSVSFCLGFLTAAILTVGRDIPHPPHGGSITPEPSASDVPSQTTAERVATYTGSKPGGPSRVARVRLGLPPEPSRTTALGDCGCGQKHATATDGQHGIPGTAANP